MNWKSYSDKVSRYFPFTKKEWIHFIVITLIFAFVFSFNEWGIEVFDFLTGIKNLTIASVIAGVSILVHHSVQRLIAIKYGHRLEHRTLWLGLFICLFAAILSNGSFLILIGSALKASFMPIHRLGKSKLGINLKSLGMIALSGPLANIAFAGIIKLINFGAQQAFLDKLIIFNMLFALFNLIPIPPLDGSYIFLGSRLFYAFSTGLILAFIGLFLLLGVSFILALLISLVFGFFCFILFYLLFEVKWH